ncbi:hypothetical protein BD560DRAFT_334908 [Blakeslea trispora]|nr:hypothetical protein BD560DRAFT_334908 [Blakeslea trispora]
MLFYVDYSEENAMKCEKRIEDLGDFEICYNVDPKQPVLVSKQRIHENHSHHLYPAKLEFPKINHGTI